MKRLVVDTNTIISALFWAGPPRRIYNSVKDGRHIEIAEKVGNLRLH